MGLGRSRHVDVEPHRHRGAGGQRGQRGVEPAVGEHRGVHAADDVAQLGDRVLRLLVRLVTSSRAPSGSVSIFALARPRFIASDDQLLLGAVVQVALDPAALGVGGVDDPGPGLGQRGDLGAQRVVLARRQQGAAPARPARRRARWSAPGRAAASTRPTPKPAATSSRCRPVQPGDDLVARQRGRRRAGSSSPATATAQNDERPGCRRPTPSGSSSRRRPSPSRTPARRSAPRSGAASCCPGSRRQRAARQVDVREQHRPGARSIDRPCRARRRPWPRGPARRAGTRAAARCSSASPTTVTVNVTMPTNSPSHVGQLEEWSSHPPVQHGRSSRSASRSPGPRVEALRDPR